MVRRAIHTGDLVVTKNHRAVSLWRYPDSTRPNEKVVEEFTTGLVLGLHQVTYYTRQFNDRPHTKLMALVLDAPTQRYGWTHTRRIKRVDDKAHGHTVETR
jgi:hypothetical protein